MAHAADIQTLHLDRRVVRADDEFRRAAADIDHQPRACTSRHGVCCTRINQTCFFTPGDHFDRKPERGLCLAEKFAGVLGDAQCIGRDRTNVIGMKVAQAFAEALERVPAPHLRGTIEHLVARQTGGETHRFTQSVDLINLAARVGFLDPAHDQAKAVRAKVDGGEELGRCDHRVSGLHARERGGGGRRIWRMSARCFGRLMAGRAVQRRHSKRTGPHDVTSQQWGCRMVPYGLRHIDDTQAIQRRIYNIQNVITTSSYCENFRASFRLSS